MIFLNRLKIRFRNLVSDLADEIPVLLSTHIVEDIEATCSELGIIGSGRLLFTGSPSSLLRQFDGRIWAVPDSRDPAPGERIVARSRPGSEDTSSAVAT